VILRRLLLIALVLLAASCLPGCATPQVICDVRDYQSPVLIPSRGEVRLTWEYRQDLPQGRYGYAVCDVQGKNCHLQLRAPAPAWTDVCGLHTYFHELLHAFGGRHE
jgi:hypothetical protein